MIQMFDWNGLDTSSSWISKLKTLYHLSLVVICKDIVPNSVGNVLGQCLGRTLDVYSYS